MRRAGNLWKDVLSFDNLMRATRRASLGKRTVAGVARFLERREAEILSIQRQLADRSYRPGKAFTFEILDPKRRTITAAPFRGRVVHHALIDPLEPIFDRRMIHDSYACRRGKGTHAALFRARQFVRRFGFFLKLDIRRCFDSLRHDVVLDTLAKIIKDRPVLWLCDRIVRGSATKTPGRGLPIGNLTSQWFANLVLDRLDHFVKETLRIRGYARYMDDFVLLADEQAQLRWALDQIAAYLQNTLGLGLKDRATLLAPVSEGLPFLGWRIYRGTTRLRPENLRRTRRRLRHRTWELEHGIIDEGQYADAVRSVAEHLRHGSTWRLRERLFEAPPSGEP